MTNGGFLHRVIHAIYCLLIIKFTLIILLLCVHVDIVNYLYLKKKLSMMKLHRKLFINIKIIDVLKTVFFIIKHIYKC